MNWFVLPHKLSGTARLTLAGFATIFMAGCDSPMQVDPGARALDRISGVEVRAHMEVLAADDMQGREAGTDAFMKAADYVAGRFEAAGLVAAGDNGSYLQDIEFLASRIKADAASMSLQRGDLQVLMTFGEDFVRSGGFGASDESVSAPLVFVGYSIRAPEYHYDDFAGIDASGKILLVLSGAPPWFDPDQRAFYSSAAGKEALAVELGAVGVITVRTTVDQQRLPWSAYTAAAGSASLRWIEADGTPHESFDRLTGNAMLSETGAATLFETAGRDLDQILEQYTTGRTGSFDLGVSVTLIRSSEQKRTHSPNVIGVIAGSDTRLRDEYIVYTAHLDHLGIRPGIDGDDIHNGAYDNAAGVAAMLEIADAIASMETKPRRSIIFAALTAEEKGLLGSDFLAHNPPVPITHIVANINIDMPYFGFPVADVEGFGVEHSTLHDALIRTTKYLGLVLTPDPRPELVRLIRSDQFSFVKRGVPGLNLKAGSISSDPEVDGATLRNEYLQIHYHHPSDDLNLPYSNKGAERFVSAALLLGLTVADDDVAPRWKDGDFFGERFGRR